MDTANHRLLSSQLVMSACSDKNIVKKKNDEDEEQSLGDNTALLLLT